MLCITQIWSGKQGILWSPDCSHAISLPFTMAGQEVHSIDSYQAVPTGRAALRADPQPSPQVSSHQAVLAKGSNGQDWCDNVTVFTSACERASLLGEGCFHYHTCKIRCLEEPVVQTLADSPSGPCSPRGIHSMWGHSGSVSGKGGDTWESNSTSQTGQPRGKRRKGVQCHLFGFGSSPDPGASDFPGKKAAFCLQSQYWFLLIFLWALTWQTLFSINLFLVAFTIFPSFNSLCGDRGMY